MNIEPFPLEKELRVEAIKRHLTELPRDELVASLAQAIDVLSASFNVLSSSEGRKNNGG